MNDPAEIPVYAVCSECKLGEIDTETAASREWSRQHTAHGMLDLVRVRLTKEAVAREAGRSSATLYRFPELLAAIETAAGTSTTQRRTASEQHRQRLVDTIAELERQNGLLLGENLRLTRLLGDMTPLSATNASWTSTARERRDVR